MLNQLYVVTSLRHGKRWTLSMPCARLEAISLRNWTRSMFGNHSTYTDIQIREVHG